MNEEDVDVSEERVSIELWRDGSILESFEGTRDEALHRAWESKALPFKRVHANFLRDLLIDFPCHEVDEATVECRSPVGQFRLAAQRVKRGQLATAHSPGGGFGETASQDQVAKPVNLGGRLLPPSHDGGMWTFQPDHFTYEDATHSHFLGMYPRRITWPDGAPPWHGASPR
ncbi:hypothetical protein LXT21_44090 [Myxococcus sp. K38C18041901]|uniref:hypothetical protein n=1 Tax=Myxococcus guangdongensis TaxID=2906760 RepID=UPI0020A6E6D6|nr:hypothetical protein [Myxococcus guangdongensis]MCP3065770.1 hypothetical protein [Myxococcus guangdongensis]